MDIIILSRNPALYSTQSLANAARKKNHYVRVIDHMHCDLVLEQGKMAVYYNNQKIEGYNAIIPRIGSSVTSYGAAVIRQFEAMGIYTTLSSDALLKSRDKLICSQILASNGIEIPKTLASNYFYYSRDMMNKIGKAPYVIKLVKGTHGMGVILSDKNSMTESLLETFSRTRQKVLLQEFISEAKGADIRVFVVDDEIVGVMKRQAREGEFRSNLHLGGIATIDVLTDEEKQVARNAVNSLGLKIAGVDMLRSSRGPMILEVNASPGLEGIETTTKVDIAGKIIAMVEKEAKAMWRL